MRKAGILMPLASLPSRTGCGDFGPQAYHFAKCIQEAGLSIWQILPLNPLGFGNSPYQPYSSYAMDDLYISLELLEQDGLIQHVPQFHKHDHAIVYEDVRKFREPYLREAYDAFVKDETYENFVCTPWVQTYAVFTALKKKNHCMTWIEWNQEDKQACERIEGYIQEDAVQYEIFKQYILCKQWKALKAYVNQLGIEIMGDLPFYVGLDSADVWGNRADFLLDEDGRPQFIAGVPPDYFSKTGQRWGNPIYNWEHMQETGFRFWKERLAYCGSLMDIVRVDHFRAFDTYWKIPASCPTAVEGEWVEAPGYALFDSLFAEYPDLKIVAEDLGDLRAEVLALRDHYDFRGMRVIQFSFNEQDMHNDKEHLLVYTGTHDNDTTFAWYKSQCTRERRRMRKCLKDLGFHTHSFVDDTIDYALSCKADMVIIPMYDWLHLSRSGRLNTPGTVGYPNWVWRLDDLSVFAKKTGQIKERLLRSRRCE